MGKNKITNLKNVAVHDTYTKGKSKFKNMLGNNILKFFRFVLEDKVKKFKWKLLVGIVDITNLVVREHTKFIKDTLMEKHDVLFEWGTFPDRLKTATMKLMYEKRDKENIYNNLGVLF